MFNKKEIQEIEEEEEERQLYTIVKHGDVYDAYWLCSCGEWNRPINKPIKHGFDYTCTNCNINHKIW